MLEMLKARKEELQARGVKGFTLMEMLIVIAIIAILIAIAIPLFTAQLDQAKNATIEANARSLYANMMADYMSTGSTATVSNGSSITYGGTTYDFEGQTATVTAGSGSTAPSITVDLYGGSSVTFPQA